MNIGSFGKATALLAAALTLGALLAACSGDDPVPTQTTVPTATATSSSQTVLPTQTSPAPQPTATPTPSVTAGGPVRDIEITLKDNTFPAELEFTPGETVRLIITNKGSVEHTFELNDFEILWEVLVDDTRAFEWTVPNQPGEYDCGCFLTGEDPAAHESMDGLCFIVRA